MALPLDEDLPGMGQYYCLHCEYVIGSYLISYHVFIRDYFGDLGFELCSKFEIMFLFSVGILRT